MNISNTLIAAALAVASAQVSAQTINASAPQAVLIASIEGVRSPANGYFVIRTAKAISGCEAGFWLPASDARHGSYLARANDAFAKSLPVVVAGDREQIWPGSTDKVCRITQLQ